MSRKKLLREVTLKSFWEISQSSEKGETICIMRKEKRDAREEEIVVAKERELVYEDQYLDLLGSFHLDETFVSTDAWTFGSIHAGDGACKVVLSSILAVVNVSNNSSSYVYLEDDPNFVDSGC